MLFLASEKLSPHKFKTPEGYLICTDVILSRTGKQDYRRCELFGDACENPDEIVQVDRTADEVFSDKAMASFENKAVCIEHPDEDVSVENHNDLSVGFVRDIHKGEYEGEPVMMGTLVITDKDAVKAIESGEYKELSCGYLCDVKDDKHPQQKNIRGNHVALCKQGRAGIARIIDSTNDAKMRWEILGTTDGVSQTWVVAAATQSEAIERAKRSIAKFELTYISSKPVKLSSEDLRYYRRRPYGHLVDSVDDAGIKVWQVHQGYAIVVERYWKQYGKNAYVDGVESNIDSARYRRGSLERNDKMRFIIIDCNNSRYRVVDSKMNEGEKDMGKNTLTEDARVVGWRIRKEGNLYVVYAEEVKLLRGAGYGSKEDAERYIHMVDKNPKIVYDNVIQDDNTTDTWTIENIGIAYILRHGDDEVKRFPTKRLAIEWVNERFPNDKVVVSDDDWTKVEEENYKKANNIEVGDKQWLRTSSSEIHASKDRGNYVVSVYNKNNLSYSDTIDIERKFGVRIEPGKYGDLVIISKDKDAIYRAFAAINPAYPVGSWRILGDEMKKDSLYTISYKKNGKTFVRKVRAANVEDAISKANKE